MDSTSLHPAKVGITTLLSDCPELFPRPNERHADRSKAPHIHLYGLPSLGYEDLLITSVYRTYGGIKRANMGSAVMKLSEIQY